MNWTQSKPYLPTGGMNPDSAGQLLQDTQAILTLNMRSSATALTTRSGCLKLGTNGLNSPALAFHTFKQANGVEIYFAFTASNIYKYNFTTSQWDPCTTESLPGTVSYWSVTDFIDLTMGPIVVAAGSNPPLEDLAESDGATRCIRVYNPATGLFNSLQTQELTQVVGEVLGVISGTNVFQQFTLTHAPAIGYLSVYTLEDGTLAYTNNVDKSTIIWNHITSVSGSTLSADTLAGSSIRTLQTSGTRYTGKTLYVNYYYKASATWRPRYVFNFSNRLVGLNFYEPTSTVLPYPTWRIRYGEAGDVAALDTRNYQELITSDTTPIVGGAKLGEYLYIFKKDSIHRVSYIGGSLIFNTQCVWSEGTVYGRTVVPIDNSIYYLGKDDVYEFDGNIPTSLTNKGGVPNKIRDEILSRIVPTKIHKVFGCYDPENDEYWLFVPSSTETYSATCYVYMRRFGIWTKFTFAQEISAAGLGKTTQGASSNAIRYVMLGAGTGTSIANNCYVCEPSTVTDFAAGIVAGTAITSTLLTKDFTFNDMMMQDRVQRFEFEALGTSVTVTWDGAFSTTPTSSSSTIALTSTLARYNYHPDAVTEQIRFKLTSTSALTLRTMIAYALAFKKTNQ